MTEVSSGSEQNVRLKMFDIYHLSMLEKSLTFIVVKVCNLGGERISPPKLPLGKSNEQSEFSNLAGNSILGLSSEEFCSFYI